MPLMHFSVLLAPSVFEVELHRMDVLERQRV